MRKDVVAQSVLSLVTTPERASPTVGDLLEESRGPLSFWWSVASTTGSLCWQDFRSAPVLIAWLGVWGWLAASLGPSLCLVPLIPFVGGMSGPLSLTFYALMAMLTLVVSFLTGWKVAEFSEGRELAAGCSVAFVFAGIYTFAGWASAMQMHRIGRPWPGREHAFAIDCCQLFCVFVAAILFRSKKARDLMSPFLQMLGFAAGRFLAILVMQAVSFVILVSIFPPPTLVRPLEYIVAIVAALLIGRDVAKKSKGRELTAGLSVASLFAASYALVVSLSANQLEPGPLRIFPDAAVTLLIPALCVVAMAILSRSGLPELSQDGR